MAWYWWLLIALIVMGIVGSMLGGRRSGGGANELNDIFEPVRRDRAEADRYSTAAIAFLRDLPIVPDPGAGQSQSHDQVAANLRSFFATRFVRTHVVAGSKRMALIQEINGRADQTVTREIVRTGADSWSVRTFPSADFAAAIRAAEDKDRSESGTE